MVHFASMLRRVGQLYDEGYEMASLHMFDQEGQNFDELFELVMSGSLQVSSTSPNRVNDVAVVDFILTGLSPELTGSNRLPPLDATAAVVQALGSWGVLGVLTCRIPTLIEDLFKAAETLAVASAPADD